MGVLEEIKKDLRKLERLNLSASFSKSKDLYDDYYYIYDMINILGLDLEKISFRKKGKYDNDIAILVSSFVENVDVLNMVSSEIIKGYKSANFDKKFYKKLPSLDADTFLNLLKEFLSYFNPEMLNIFEELYNSNHIVIHDLEGSSGLTYYLKVLDSYYIVLDEFKCDLYDVEVIIHELMHVYNVKFLRNYPRDMMNGLLKGLLSEATTLYTELSFQKWIEDNHPEYYQMISDIKKYEQYLALTWYKTMNYLTEVITRDDVTICFSGEDYEVEGNGKLENNEIDPLYRYDGFEDGNINAIIYGTSRLIAMDMFKREKNGEKTVNIVNNFLINQANPEFLDDYFENEVDLDFMRKELTVGDNKRLGKIKKSAQG